MHYRKGTVRNYGDGYNMSIVDKRVLITLRVYVCVVMTSYYNEHKRALPDKYTLRISIMNIQ